MMNNNPHTPSSMIAKASKIFLILGTIFFCLGVVFLTVSLLFLDKDTEEWLVLIINGSIFSLLGGTFAAVGGALLYTEKKQTMKKDRLMKNGIQYEAKVVRVYENSYYRVNYRSPVIAECVYEDSYGKTYLVKSGNIWDTNPYTRKSEDIRARVFVNRHDPKDYFVDIYFASEEGNSDIRYDYDYR